jgi:hypothetical protein
MSYVKLDCGITDSTIWMEDSDTIRVWIYLLAKADFTGTVTVTLPAIARDNLIPIGKCEEILEKLKSPDRYSRNQDRDGRRIQVYTSPTWAIEILNYAGYREKNFTNAERQRSYRERNSVAKSNEPLQNVTDGNFQSRNITQAEAEAEAYKDPPIPPKRGIPGFDEFWKAYPKKIGKGAAEKAFVRAKINGRLNEILDAITKQKGSPGWTKNNGEFIPNPATWINQRRWEDDLGQAQKSEFAWMKNQNGHRRRLKPP